MAVKQILLLGNPVLYETCEPVREAERDRIQPVVQDLHDTMIDFREKYHFGRAIGAPQIGVPKRLVYMHIDKPVVFINPVLDLKSAEMIELWDNCMSFPDLLVKVFRHRTFRITYRDETWTEKHLDLEGDLSELVQHEVDHLDGILAVQRAIDHQSFALKIQCRLLKGMHRHQTLPFTHTRRRMPTL